MIIALLHDYSTKLEPVIIDTALVSIAISNLKLGKSRDIDELQAEHILHAHPIFNYHNYWNFQNVCLN